MALTQLKSALDMATAATAGLTYLKYLTDTWMTLALWHGWSQKGRIEASFILKISIEGVIPTTNHLEVFNGVLKRKHIHRWQHAGKRLRFDLFIYLLITQILPGIFYNRNAQETYLTWLSNRFRVEAGGVDLIAARKALQASAQAPMDLQAFKSPQQGAQHLEQPAEYTPRESPATAWHCIRRPERLCPQRRHPCERRAQGFEDLRTHPARAGRQSPAGAGQRSRRPQQYRLQTDALRSRRAPQRRVAPQITRAHQRR